MVPFLCVMVALGLSGTGEGISFAWPGMPSWGCVGARRVEVTTNLHLSAR